MALEAEGMQALSPPAEQQGAPQKQNPTCLRVELCLWKRSEQGPGTQPPGVLCGWALTLGPSQAEERLGCGGVGGRVTAILLGEQSSGRRQGSPAVPALSQYPSLGRVNTEPPGLAAQAACSAGPVGRAEPGLQLLQRTGAVEPARPRSGWDARPACTGGLYAIGLPERHPGWESVAPREGVEQGSLLGPLCRASGSPGGRHFLPASTSPCRAWAAHQSLHSALRAQTSCLELWGHHQSLDGCLCPPGLQGTWYRKGWGLGREALPGWGGRQALVSCGWARAVVGQVVLDGWMVLGWSRCRPSREATAQEGTRDSSPRGALRERSWSLLGDFSFWIRESQEAGPASLKRVCSPGLVSA